MATTEEGTPKSSQPGEVIAALLTLRQTATEGKRKTYIYFLQFLAHVQWYSHKYGYQNVEPLAGR